MYTVRYCHNGIVYESHEPAYPSAIRSILSQIKYRTGSRPTIKQVLQNCWVSQ